MKSHDLLKTILFAFIFISSQIANATNTLEITGGQTSENDTAFISINMVNDSAIVAFQIDIPMPDQLTYISNTAILDASRITDHVLDAKMLPGDTLRIFGYSLSNTPFTGNSGTIVTFKLYTGTVPGDYPLVLINPLVGDTSSTNVLTGSINGTETILGPNISLSVNSLNFGEVPLLDSTDRSLTVYNIGNQDLNIQSISFDTTYFSVVGNTNFTISAGQSQSVTVRFNSVVKGNYSNQMTIASNDYDESFMDVDLSVIAFAVNELHTGNMSVFSGDYATLEFTINNMEPVVSFQFDLTLPDPLSFATDSASLSSRKANHLVSANMINNTVLRVVAYSSDNQWFTGNNGLILELGFNVDGVGGYYGIGINNVVIGDSLGLNAVSAYTGGSLQIAAADIAATNSINFGNVSILGSSTENLTVYNYGNDTLEITSIQFSNSSFSSTQTLPLNINPGDSHTLDIGFSNTNEGTVSGTIKFFSNDPDENPFTVNLTGYAFVPNYISVYDSMYSYGDTMFVDIVVDNLEPFTGFQFDLSYTDSLTCLTNLIQLGPRGGNHVIQVNEIDSNTVRLFAYSLTQTEIAGNSGAIVRIPFVGDSAVYGTIPMALDSAILGNSQSEDILWGMINESIIIAKPQEIILQSGWNIFSTNVSPNYMNIDSILAKQMSDQNLVKVIDEEGHFLQNISGNGWMNTIGSLEVTDGYYIKVNETDTIECEGNPVEVPITIALQTGWNIMGYPLVNEQDALQALQGIVNNGSLYKIMDEQGGFIQNIDGIGWLNTIGNFEPGEGYYIKVNSNTNLILDESGSKSNLILNGNIPLVYFSPIQGDAIYNPMNFVLKLQNENNNIVTAGDELAIFDGAFCVGATVFSENNQGYISIVTSMNDDDFEMIVGYGTGNNFNFKFWDNETGALYANVTPDNQNNILGFQPLETYIGVLSTNALGITESNNNKNGILNIVVAPNPVNNKLNVYYRSPNIGKSTIRIFNSSGNMVLSNNYDNLEEGWSSSIINVNNIKGGIYFGEIKFTSEDEIITEHFKFIKL